MIKQGFKIELVSGGEADLEFYGVIGAPSYFDEDDVVQASAVIKSLKEMGKVAKLTVRMNSPGGDVYDGFQIANRLDALRENGQIGEIETVAEGIVASAATLVFLKGDKRTMRNGSKFMIHKPWTMGVGNAEDLRAAASKMDQTEEQAIDLYEASSALTRQELRAAMEAETYYTPAEAVAAGFATDAIEPFRIAACMSDRVRLQFHHRMPADMEVTSPAWQRRAEFEKQLAIHPDNW